MDKKNRIGAKITMLNTVNIFKVNDIEMVKSAIENRIAKIIIIHSYPKRRNTCAQPLSFVWTAPKPLCK